VATIPARVALFLSSYSPLFLILALLNSGDTIVSGVFYVIAATSIITLYLFMRSYRDTTPSTIKIKSVSSRDSDVMSYIVSYLLPFLGISFKEVSNAISFVIFITVIGIIYVSSNMVFVNPVLNLRGYHMLEIDDGTGKVCALITRRPYVAPGDSIDTVPLADFALLEKRRE